MNSPRAPIVGSGANILISGWSSRRVGGIRKVLIRAAGPGLGAWGVPGTIATRSFP